MGVEFTCSCTGKRGELLIVYDGNDDMTIETVSGKESSHSPQTLSSQEKICPLSRDFGRAKDPNTNCRAE